MKNLKKLLAITLVIMLLGGFSVFAEEEITRSPIFEENFENWVSNQDLNDWYPTEDYKSTNATVTNIYTGESVTVTNSDNFPSSSAFTNEKMCYMIKQDPTDSENKMLNIGGFGMDKRIISRDLPENTKSKIFEAILETITFIKHMIHSCY